MITNTYHGYSVVASVSNRCQETNKENMKVPIIGNIVAFPDGVKTATVFECASHMA
jgi:hypothetical protein